MLQWPSPSSTMLSLRRCLAALACFILLSHHIVLGEGVANGGSNEFTSSADESASATTETESEEETEQQRLVAEYEAFVAQRFDRPFVTQAPVKIEAKAISGTFSPENQMMILQERMSIAWDNETTSFSRYSHAIQIGIDNGGIGALKVFVAWPQESSIRLEERPPQVSPTAYEPGTFEVVDQERLIRVLVNLPDREEPFNQCTVILEYAIIDAVWVTMGDNLHEIPVRVR